MGNLQSLFLSFEGRIARGRFWLGVVIMIVVAIVLSLIISPIFGVSMFSMPDMSTSTSSAEVQAMADQMADANRRGGWAGLVSYLIVLYPMAALIIKRRHDRGKSGVEFWVYAALAILLLLLQATGLGYSITMVGDVAIPTPNLVYSVVGFVAAILGIYLLVVCGFLKGDSGDNVYGPDPLGGN